MKTNRKTLIIIIIIVVCLMVPLIRKIINDISYNEILSNQGSVKSLNEEYDIQFMRTAFPVHNDPLKIGLFLDATGALSDFVADSDSCGSPFYIYQLEWKDDTFKYEKLSYIKEYKKVPISIEIDENENVFVLYVDQLNIYNSNGKKLIEKDFGESVSILNFYIEQENIYILTDEQKIILYNWKNNSIVEEKNIESINGEIICLKKYIFSYEQQKIFIYDIEGEEVGEIFCPEGFDVSRDIFDYKNGKLYILTESGLYKAELSAEEFKLIASKAELSAAMDIDDYFSIVVDDSENIYISYNYKLVEEFGTEGMVKLVEK